MVEKITKSLDLVYNSKCGGKAAAMLLRSTFYTAICAVSSYRIQNCFLTISAKILVNHYYFRDLWRILWCKSLWITHIFAMNSDISVALIVTILSAIFNHQLCDFLRDWIVELPTFSQILVTFLVIIFVSLPLFFPHFSYRFRTLIFAKSGD